LCEFLFPYLTTMILRFYPMGWGWLLGCLVVAWWLLLVVGVVILFITLFIIIKKCIDIIKL